MEEVVTEEEGGRRRGEMRQRLEGRSETENGGWKSKVQDFASRAKPSNSSKSIAGSGAHRPTKIPARLRLSISLSAPSPSSVDLPRFVTNLDRGVERESGRGFDAAAPVRDGVFGGAADALRAADTDTQPLYAGGGDVRQGHSHVLTADIPADLPRCPPNPRRRLPHFS
ncbi:hypothetical protein ZIOFF_003282 [Zingiber officinale]|uniref:Uncharacterized protein n=1 Tax=Zingiber officinale TaxID=94328 RepID=A0A8J5LZP0_ZINOF|nr:hypothetical protein ZIOFF_003282 [Zingiber officinale]